MLLLQPVPAASGWFDSGEYGKAQSPVEDIAAGRVPTQRPMNVQFHAGHEEDGNISPTILVNKGCPPMSFSRYLAPIATAATLFAAVLATTLITIKAARPA